MAQSAQCFSTSKERDDDDLAAALDRDGIAGLVGWVESNSSNGETRKVFAGYREFVKEG